MRDLIFRGKTTSDGRWVISDSISQENGKVYLYDEVKDIYVEVNPETVGQYTGLTDKNGVNIFEGDILAEYRYSVLCKERKVKKHTVIFDSDFCGFLPFADYDCDCGIYTEPNDCEIIGNKYDNGDLL